MGSRPNVPSYIRTWLDEHPPVAPHTPTPAVNETTAATDMDKDRVAMRKFDPLQLTPPVAFTCRCEYCGQTSDGRFEHVENQTILRADCCEQGRRGTVHADHIFGGSDELRTYTGSRINRNHHTLPRTVETLCPECGAVVLGRHYVRDNIVHHEKNCPTHGYFQDIIARDAQLYLRAAQWSYYEHPGMTNPQTVNAKRCPSDCGLCNQHQSPSCLSQIDLTNRCNLRCPVCFANAAVRGFVYEPTFEQAEQMLQALRDMRPVPATSVQFTGGEPTIHPDFLRLVARAREMGFSHIQIATNGLKMADPDFARAARDAGLHTLYLQFDGLDDEIYLKTRGRKLLDIKYKTIENCRELGLKVCLVPTVIRGETDDQVPKILRFALDNVDVISGIAYQPVCFTGRIDREELQEKRYTLTDLAHDISSACEADPYQDFYPLSFAAPFSDMLSALSGQPKIRTSSHTDCGFGTYLVVGDNGQTVPFPQLFNLEQLFYDFLKRVDKIERRGRSNIFDKLHVGYLFMKHYRRDRAPEWFSIRRYIRSLLGAVDKNKGRGRSGTRNYRTLMAAGMHFQDRYNFDVERVKRCVILYSTPQGIYPFCTYNSGPTWRTHIEDMNRREDLSAAPAADTGAAEDIPASRVAQLSCGDSAGSLATAPSSTHEQN